MGFFSEKSDTKLGRIIISVIWGLGLAALFRSACKGRRCIVLMGPPPSEFAESTYKFDGKCYKFAPETTKCQAQSIPVTGKSEEDTQTALGKQ
jgi:hypothetical protein